MQDRRLNGPTSTAAVTSNNAPFHVYSFPLLKASEIYSVLRNMQITVNDPDIRKYEPPLIRRIFEVFIEKIMGITKEEMGQPAFSGLRALDFPELHEESIPELTFFRTISKLMGYCGIYDFSFRDLLYPSPKRLRRQLSALINFAKFREERLSTFAGLSKETVSFYSTVTNLTVSIRKIY